MKAKEIRKNWKEYDFQNCCVKGDAWTLEKWIDAAKTILDIDNVSITLIVKDALNEKCPVNADKNTFEEIAKWHLQRCLISTNYNDTRPLKKLRKTLLSYGK